ncbi:hypothetical protein [Intestinibacter sp.]
MLIKIWKEQDLDLLQVFDKEVKEVIKDNVRILAQEYGEERTEADLGGYVAIVDNIGLKELKQNQLKGLVAEYIDEIEGTDYMSVLFLCSNDFSVVVVCNKELIDEID